MKLLSVALALHLAAGAAAAQSQETGAVWDQIRLLRDGSAEKREQGALALAAMGERAAPAARHLIEVLDDDEVPVYVAAGFALARIGRAALPEMRKAIEDGNDTVRAEVAHILERMNEEALPAVPALVGVLDGGSPAARESVASAIGTILDGVDAAPPEGTVAALERLLNERGSTGNSHARAAAALALGKLGAHAEAAVPSLLVGLEDDDPRVRTASAWALGGGHFEPTPSRWLRPRDERAGIGSAPELVVPALTFALADYDPGVRWAAAQSLAAYGEAAQPAAERLRELIGEMNVAVHQDEADAALLEQFRLRRPIGETGMLRVPARPSMVPRLMTIALRQSTPVRTLTNTVSVVQSGVVAVPPGAPPAPPEAAAGAPPPPPVNRPDLALHLSVVRLHAAATLWELGDETASSAVVAVLRDDENAAARELAAMFLARMGTPEAIPVLSAALQDDDWQVREAAALALRAIDRR